MGKTTAIEWTDATWNPWIGCTKVSPACANCYAERDMKRYGRDFNKITRTSNKTFYSPQTWKEPKKVFVCSWSDFFHNDVPPEWRRDAMEVMERCPQHTFLLLTKRPENIVPFAMRRWGKIPDNVWIGTTIETQSMADKRIPELLKVNAAVRFVSIEPMLGPVNIDPWLSHALVNWVIVGGESGPHARGLHIDWVRSLRDQCANAHVPFMFKQWGEVGHDGVRRGRKLTGCALDGKTHKESPDVKTQRVI